MVEAVQEYMRPVEVSSQNRLGSGLGAFTEYFRQGSIGAVRHACPKIASRTNQEDIQPNDLLADAVIVL
jgi:hypothetical protein